jgi:hypothetical protein
MDVLKAFHGARDKHTFRILGTHNQPSALHIPLVGEPWTGLKSEQNTRRRFELGQELGPAVCMGDFLNVEVVNHCVLIAQRMLFLKMMSPHAGALLCIKIASSTFPALVVPRRLLQNLNYFPSAGRSLLRDQKGSKSGIVTCLSCTLSAAARRGVDHTVSAVVLDSDTRWYTF